MKAPDSNQMNLLFITQTTQTITNLKTLEDHDAREINRRAQQNAYIKRKALRALRPLGKRPRDLKPKREQQRDDQDDTDRLDKTKAPAKWPERTALTTTVDKSQDFLAPSVRAYLNSYRMDPFSTSKVDMTPQMDTVFMYYFTTIMPVVEPVQAEREEYHQWLVPMAMTEPALMYAIVGCMAYDIEQASAVGFGPPSRRNMTTQRVSYRIRAIQALNERLSDSDRAIEPSTLMAVHFLLWQEIFAGDECIHLDGVVRLLKLRGGFEGVQRKAIEAMNVGSFWRSVRTRTKPMLPEVVDLLPISDLRYQLILSSADPSHARLGEAFLRPELTQHFDDGFLDLMRDARRAWVCFEEIGVGELLFSEKKSASMQRLQIDHRFLSYPFDHFGPYRPIQEAIRQAFILFSNASYNVVQPSSKIARCLVEDLKSALEATDLKTCWGSAYKALLWALLMGAHMCFGQRERPWFVTALARVGQNLPRRDWFQVRGELVQFYYLDRVCQESFKKIWDEVEVVATLWALF